MKRKVRKMSIRWKILIPVTIIFIIGCISIGYSAVNSYNEELKKTALSKAEAACNVAVHSINGDDLKLIKKGDEDTSIYKNSIEALSEIAEYCGVKYLYSLYEEDGIVYYGLDIDKTEDKAMIGDEYEEEYAELISVFNGETIKSEEIEHTEDGDYLLTVYNPIYDSDGKIVGVLGCDYDAEHVINSRYSIIVKLIGLLAINLLVDLLLINIIVGKTIKVIQMVDAKLYDLVNNEGDLTQNLDVNSGDEAELIADNVNGLLAYIRQIIINIANNSETLQVSSGNVVKNVGVAEDKISDITSVMEQMSAAMQETSASLNQVSDEVNNITSVVGNISQNAEESSVSSSKIMKDATNLYNQTLVKKKEVSDEANEMTISINSSIEKAKDVEKVNSLTKEILEITEQTTLLALNAAIEAARAGDAGRGFAVVADEIGKLANNSSQAAGEIQRVNEEVLSSVHALANEAKRMVEFLENVTIKGYEELLSTSESYEQNMSALNQMFENFSIECDHLKVNIENIKDTIDAVNVAVEESANGVGQVTESAVDLTHGIMQISEEAKSNETVSLHLKDEVNKFTY